MADILRGRLTLASPATAEWRLLRFCLAPAFTATVIAVVVQGQVWQSDPRNATLNVLLSALLATAAGLLTYPVVVPRRPLCWTLLAGAVLWPATWAGSWGGSFATRAGEFSNVLFWFAVTCAVLLHLDGGAWRWPVRVFVAASAFVLPVGEVVLAMAGRTYRDAATLLAVADAAIVLLFATVVGLHLRRVPGRERWAALGVIVPVVAAAALTAAEGPRSVPEPSYWVAASTAGLILFPLALIAQAWRSRALGARLADEIARMPMLTGAVVRDGLRRAVGDESLDVFYRLTDQKLFVNESGDERCDRPPAEGRYVITVDDPTEPAGSGPVAMVEVDARFRHWPQAERLRTVAMLSSRDLAMARLDTVTKVWSKRIRAGDLAQRRELEQVLHEQVQQRVSAISMTLGRLGLRTASDATATASVRLAQQELSVALDQLRSVAEALYSPLLRESGLAPALEHLGRSVDLPVRVTVANEAELDDTMRAAAMTAAQDIVGDAATILDGIRQPPGLHIDVSAAGKTLVVRVVTDQADLMAPGNRRIRLLSARAAEAGGGIQLEPRPGPGTTMTVRIPCG
ncbi:hypothetical protein JIG36_26060 [Actinoplanes sp. LDG1-06]|uniref:Histidine kinase n=1 Tax=Paractinoplanes ovalisporus TaxID=2810368 RepID=A0ABS2AIJ7_9ACTN|nr:hypothetical protein [Actinoplanes ovalisporus]MBM2619026.1 hypothetical protein [Actinoplanes ovalisporus]